MKVLLALMALMLTGTALRAQETANIPAFDQVSEISFLSEKGWHLKIFENGSAQLGYGAGPDDIADAPPNSFSFKAVYALLVPHLGKQVDEREDLAVHFHLKTILNPTGPFYLQDKDVIRKTMSQAVVMSVPFDSKRFNRLLKEYPPVPAK